MKGKTSWILVLKSFTTMPEADKELVFISAPTTEELRAPRVPPTTACLRSATRKKLNGTTFTHGYSLVFHEVE